MVDVDQNRFVKTSLVVLVVFQVNIFYYNYVIFILI